MTPIKYLTDQATGCCTTKELLDLSRADKAAVETLKQWAKDEMSARGIPVEEPTKAA